MPNIKEITITDFDAFVKSVGNKSPGALSQFWFRGVGKSSYKLSPSILRHECIKTIDKLFEMEKDLLTRYRERSVPYLKEQLSSSWEMLFVMQHYGMPTRLLDWTENPLIALFFAVSSAKKTKATKKSALAFNEDAAVWVLSPSKWNKAVFSQQSYQGAAISPSSDLVKSYEVGADHKYMNQYPVAILGIHNSPRIVAQRGSFTLFGKSLKSMDEEFSSSESFDDDALFKLIIPAAEIQNFLDKLVWMGMSDSVIYPDLEGLAKETKRQFGYEV